MNLEQLLAGLGAEVAALREDVQHLHRRLLDAGDRRDLALLLPAAHALMGGASWTAEDLATRAAVESMPAADAVAGVVACYVTERGGLRLLGRFLSRVEGVPTQGMRLLRVGTAREGSLYTIAGFEGRETRSGAGAGAGLSAG